MPNDKEMYLTMVRHTEKAIQLLIEAQRKCEDMYVNAPDASFVLVEKSTEKKHGKE